MGDFNNRMAELNVVTSKLEVNDISLTNSNNNNDSIIGKRATTDIITPVIEEGQFNDAVVDLEDTMTLTTTTTTTNAVTTTTTTTTTNTTINMNHQQHNDNHNHIAGEIVTTTANTTATAAAANNGVGGSSGAGDEVTITNRSDDDDDEDDTTNTTTTPTTSSTTSAPATTNGDDDDQNTDHDTNQHQLSSNSPVEDPVLAPSRPQLAGLAATAAAATAASTPSPLLQESKPPQPNASDVRGGGSFSRVEVEITPAQPHAPVLAPAPVLRVEQLREEDFGSPMSSYTSEEEGYSFPDLSDDPEERDQEKLPEFVEPSEELREKIVNQVEFYFSDTNILKDAFLLKHVRRNKQGFVSLKLLTSFRKVKTLTKDYRVVAFSLQKSKILEVNEEGTKVRRTDPLPEYDETTPSRTVVVVNLPIKNPAIENVAELFSKCGVISLIRILRPKGSIPPDIKKFSSKHPEIGTALCAVIEFETFEGAKQACGMHNRDDWRSGMRVVQLSARKKDKEKKKPAPAASNNGLKNGSASSNHGMADKEIVGVEDKKKKKGSRKKKRVDELTRETESSCYSSGSEADTPQAFLHTPSLDPSKLSPVTTPKPSPRSTPKSSPRTQRRKWMSKKSPLAEPENSPKISPQISPESLRKKYDNGDAPSSPWVQRRLKAAQAHQNSMALTDDKNGQPAVGRSPKGSPLLLRRGRLHDSELAVRSPKGPDGSSGFYGGMGRGKLPNNITITTTTTNNNTTTANVATVAATTTITIDPTATTTTTTTTTLPEITA
ncbi:la-related protein 6-like [Argonauta hians]